MVCRSCACFMDGKGTTCTGLADESGSFTAPSEHRGVLLYRDGCLWLFKLRHTCQPSLMDRLTCKATSGAWARLDIWPSSQSRPGATLNDTALFLPEQEAVCLKSHHCTARDARRRGARPPPAIGGPGDSAATCFTLCPGQVHAQFADPPRPLHRHHGRCQHRTE